MNPLTPGRVHPLDERRGNRAARNPGNVEHHVALNAVILDLVPDGVGQEVAFFFSVVSPEDRPKYLEYGGVKVIGSQITKPIS
jgi:hypothetical protein